MEKLDTVNMTSAELKEKYDEYVKEVAEIFNARGDKKRLSELIYMIDEINKALRDNNILGELHRLSGNNYDLLKYMEIYEQFEKKTCSKTDDSEDTIEKLDMGNMTKGNLKEKYDKYVNEVAKLIHTGCGDLNKLRELIHTIDGINMAVTTNDFFEVFCSLPRNNNNFLHFIKAYEQFKQMTYPKTKDLSEIIENVLKKEYNECVNLLAKIVFNRGTLQNLSKLIHIIDVINGCERDNNILEAIRRLSGNNYDLLKCMEYCKKINQETCLRNTDYREFMESLDTRNMTRAKLQEEYGKYVNEAAEIILTGGDVNKLRELIHMIDGINRSVSYKDFLDAFCSLSGNEVDLFRYYELFGHESSIIAANSGDGVDTKPGYAKERKPTDKNS